MNYIKVASPSYQKCIEAKLLARFIAQIGGVSHELAITEIPGRETVLTHVATGARMARVHSTDVAVGRHDWEVIGRLTLDKLILSKGEARIASAIRNQELNYANANR